MLEWKKEKRGKKGKKEKSGTEKTSGQSFAIYGIFVRYGSARILLFHPCNSEKDSIILFKRTSNDICDNEYIK